MSALFNRLWKYSRDSTGMRITATLKRDAHLPADNRKETYRRAVNIKAGTKVRIWAISRFGDIGITDDLSNTCCGYSIRVGPFNLAEDDPRYEAEKVETWVDGFEVDPEDLKKLRADYDKLSIKKPREFWENDILQRTIEMLEDQGIL